MSLHPPDLQFADGGAHLPTMRSRPGATMKLNLNPAQLTTDAAAALERGVDAALSQAASTILSTMNWSPEDRLATDPQLRAAQKAKLATTIAAQGDAELKSKLDGAEGVLYTDFTGLNVKRMTELRRRFAISLEPC